MADNTHTGHCLCGDIRFRVEGDPQLVGHCHCDSCRRHTGAAVATFLSFHPNQVTFTKGERKIFDSSPGVHRGFCTNCGTPLTYETDKYPDVIQFNLSTFDDPQCFTAELHTFYEERVHWFEVDDDLPRHATIPDEWQ